MQPTQVVDVFTQKMTLRFSGDQIPPKEILLRAHVKGEIDVSPRTFRFKDGAVQVINVKCPVPGAKLQSFECMSSVLAIQRKEIVSESEVNLHVFHSSPAGQAFEVLRVGYTVPEAKDVQHIEAKLGVSSAQDFRFIPSSLLIADHDSESIRKVFLAFSGSYCPADDETPKIVVRLLNGESAEMKDTALSVTRMKRRLFEIRIPTSSLAFPADSDGVVVQFSSREFFVPFVK